MDLCKLDEAYESLEFVLNKDPEFAQAWFIKSKCLDLMERHEEALKCVDIGLYLNQNAAGGWVSKGFSLCGLEKYDEAIECFNIALSIDPELVDALYTLAFVYLSVEDYEKAIEYANKTFKLDSTNYVAFLVKSCALAVLDRTDEALDVLNCGLKFHPDEKELIDIKNDILN